MIIDYKKKFVTILAVQSSKFKFSFTRMTFKKNKETLKIKITMDNDEK